MIRTFFVSMMDESTQELFFTSMMWWIDRFEILSDNKLGVIPFRIFLKGVIVKPQLYIFLYSQTDTYFKVISKATRASSNKIIDDLILNIPNGSNGFKLMHINMYILHVYLHVKEYVADITFSIILKVKVPTFRSFL